LKKTEKTEPPGVFTRMLLRLVFLSFKKKGERFITSTALKNSHNYMVDMLSSREDVASFEDNSELDKMNVDISVNFKNGIMLRISSQNRRSIPEGYVIDQYKSGELQKQGYCSQDFSNTSPEFCRKQLEDFSVCMGRLSEKTLPAPSKRSLSLDEVVGKTTGLDKPRDLMK